MPSHSGIVMHAPAPGQQQARTWRKASSAVAAGDIRKAISLLDKLLEQNSDHHDARLLLADLFIRQQRHASAEILLTNGLVRQPSHAPFAMLLARLLVADKRYKEAVNHLQAIPVGAGQDAEYHALLAGLHQRIGDPDSATRHYTLALELAPDHGEWWMGLGISQEQAGDGHAAQLAYRRALNYPLKTVLQKFVNQRLQQIKMPLQGSIKHTQGKV